MGRTRAVRECLQQATGVLCAATSGPAAIGLATAADVQAPQTGRGALHGHG
ncbi:hypothetical protein ACFWA4_21795 [Streptomyces sp. NPDC060011]|uniref:hypothetical protein n=1 Tax=unclassified Streptomyces TaxID=2593676 RepID=UPI0013BCC978|nr:MULTISPECIES: hypothetical protein [unclassified Streptomyces]NEB27736.1 hypothetical protein [Streptomyces sp. SID14446]WSD75791.1 hypothetical protein OHB33_05455 [Streptomyces sp. NBC_01558]